MKLIKTARYHPRTFPMTAKASAVIVLLVSGPDARQCCLLLRRPQQLRAYPGDWCLPGGRRDAADTDLLTTAWRELEEETGIPRQHCELLYQLDDFYNGSGELVRPFVITIDQATFNRCFSPQPGEVVDSLLVDCEQLKALQDGSPPNHHSTRNPTYHLPLGASYLWGLTASILAHADNVLHNQNRPIDYGFKYYSLQGR